MLSELVLDARQARRVILPGLKSLHQTREEPEMGTRDMKLMICKSKTNVFDYKHWYDSLCNIKKKIYIYIYIHEKNKHLKTRIEHDILYTSLFDILHTHVELIAMSCVMCVHVRTSLLQRRCIPLR